MKVAVYGKQFQQEVAPFVYELFLELEKAEMEVLVYEPFYNFLSKQIAPKSIFRNIQFITKNLKKILTYS